MRMDPERLSQNVDSQSDSDSVDATGEGESLSRACTLDHELNTLGDPAATGMVHNWVLRSPVTNDIFLRGAFNALLDESAKLPAEQRLIMYDACDDQEIVQDLGVVRKRLDARRNTKPKPADQQRLVCTPFDPKAFNFTKIRNDKERVMGVQLETGPYEVLSNKFPLFPKHMLLVSKQLVPQQMTAHHLAAIRELLRASSFCAYFNSWCASASVNHFHCHLIDELPPVGRLSLAPGPMVLGQRVLQPQRYPGFCYVFTWSQLELVDEVVRAMQAENQPHNFMFTTRHVYVFPKPLARPARSFELYPETVGGPELIGSFTVYTREHYDQLTGTDADELIRINTAPLPSRLLRHGGVGDCVDDAAVPAQMRKLVSLRSCASLDGFEAFLANQAGALPHASLRSAYATR